MKTLPEIGLGTACLLKSSLPEFIDVAARHGFRRITARPFAFTEALRMGHSEAELRRRVSDAGITVTMIDGLNSGLPGVPDPQSLDAAARAIMPPDVLYPPTLEDCLRAARALGATMLNVVPYRGEVVPVEQMAEAISRICRRAAEDGIEIILEFVPESGISDLGRALAVWDACGDANCRLLLDVFHLCRSGGSVDDVRAIPDGAIAAIQISDRDQRQTGHVPFGGRLMPGEGSLPLSALMSAALENNPGATIDIEVLNAGLASLSSDEAAGRLSQAAAAWRAAFVAEDG